MSAMLTHAALAMDIGGSHVTAAVVDLERREVVASSRARRYVRENLAAEELLAQWASAGLEAVAAFPGVMIRHAGVGMPGPFEYASGVSRLTHKFAALYGVNVGEALRERWRRTPMANAPVLFANDAALWALGEWWGGAGRGLRRVVGVTLGTGLGSGFIDTGRVVTQGEGVPPGGEIWNVPFRDGISEDYASGRSIARAYSQRGGAELSPAAIAMRAFAGEPEARQAYAELGANLAAILGPWLGRFDAEALIIGGSIARSWELLRPALQAGLPCMSCRVTAHFEESTLLGGAVLAP